MKPPEYLIYCLLIFFGPKHGVKVTFSKALHFDAGILYEYEYSLSTAVAPISVDFGKVTATIMEAVIQIHSIWKNPQNQQEQLLHFKIQDLKLISSDIGKQLAMAELENNNVKEGFIVHFRSGMIQAFFDPSKEKTISLDFKKGLASLLQIQTTSGDVIEDDATGRCQVSYHTLSNEIIKVKDYENCEKTTGDHTFSEQTLRVSSAGSSKTVFILEGSTMKSVTSQEFRSVVLDEQTSVGIHISSRQLLRLLSTKSGANEEAQGELQEVLTLYKGSHVTHTIHAIAAVRQPALSGCPISDLLGHLKTNRMNTFKSTTKVFLQLSECLYNMEKNEIGIILKKSDSMLVPILIDAAAAASTPAALDAVVSYLDVTHPKESTLLEKFLYSCAFSSQPSLHLLSVISNILSHTSLEHQTHEITLIVLGTVIRKMCSANMCNLQEVVNAKRLILQGLSTAKDETELKSHLLALKSARLPETVPVLLQYIDRSKTISSIVLSALDGLPSQNITKEIKEHVRDIFTQRKRSFSAPVRVAAAQILLTHDPLYKDIREVILRIATEKPEVSKFLSAKITSMLQLDHQTRNIILKVLKDLKLNNYYHLGRVGCSSSYSGLIAKTKDTITSYDLNFLFSESGALKQSQSLFSTQTRKGSLHSLQVSLELGGFDTFFETELKEDTEDEELMAGMSAMFLGVQIQPIVFFQGYGDLMSKYFSADEGPMKILSGNILVMNQRQNLILQSGLQTHVFFHGGLSVDVSADLEFSLFTQESKSSVRNKFSIVVSARADVDFPLMKTTVESVAGMKSSISFVTTVNFSNTPMQYCLQLIREPLLYRERTFRQVTAQNTSKTVQQRRQKWIVPGEETALHRDNSKMCRTLLNDEWQ